MASTSSKPVRKSRTKLRKPKFLSLRLELSPLQSSDTIAAAAGMRRRDRRKRKTSIQLNRLPLIKPETFPDDEEMRDDENVAADFLFNGDDSSATTLSALLDGGIDAATATEMASSPIDSVGSRDSVSNQLRDAVEYRDHGGHHDPITSSLLLRAAMKGGGRNQGENQRVEKWVSYSEVVDRKPQEDEVSSCAAATDNTGGRRWQRAAEKEVGLLLCLKLDYQQVLNSWSDKGSLFIQGGGGGGFSHEPPPQTVPDLSTESLTGRDSTVNMDGLGSAVNLWAVPEDPKGDVNNNNNNNLEDKGQGWFRQREASVLRYKEKRQNRLFAKRIRYEVRKLNAEKRPRVKGRFVRRDCEDDDGDQ